MKAATKSTAVSRVQLREWTCARAGKARGLLAQLRAAGYVPVDLAVDECNRKGADWTDEAGRGCALRPYGRQQWEGRREWLPHERDELRLIERQGKAEDARERETALRRARMALTVESFPKSLVDYRRRADEWAELGLSTIERLADGTTYPGCRLDDDSQDAVRAAIASILATLAAATYRYDGEHGERLRAEPAAFDARHDRQLQAILQQVGVRPTQGM